MKKAKPVVILIVKLVVSAGLLVYLLSRIHIERFWGTLASADFSYIAFALIVYLFTQSISALRWAVLARPMGFATPFTDVVGYYLIGMFFNLFAPGTVGGDVSRVYYLARDGEQGAPHGWARSTLPAAVSVFMDRAVGMVVLVWLGALGLALFPRYEVPLLIRYVTFTLAVGFIVAGVCVPLLRRALPEDGHPFVVKLRLALRSYRARWQVIPQAMTLSFVIHLIQAWMHAILGQAIGIDIPFSYCLILYPLVGTFAAIPISLNGIGLREGGYVVLLGVIGVNSTQGVAFGLLLFSVVVLDSLIGGLAFLLKKDPRPSVAAPAP